MRKVIAELQVSKGGKEMNIKAKLIEFMIKNDFIPARIRWKRSASGVGRLFNDVFNMHACMPPRATNAQA